ncbi:MAG: histidinol dehydrogenase [Opitutales bacterium]|nr:histidinol dehydrogenase [Opitutales bacterium]
MKILDFNSKNFWQSLSKAATPVMSLKDVSEIVAKVLQDVKERGDSALIEYTKKFDRANLTPKTLRVCEDEIKAAAKAVPAADKKEIKNAIACVKFFHKRTMPKNWRAKNPHGATVGENFYPIRRVGLYIPGGQVPLVSTVVMTATLAKLAGCPEICVCTPPSPEGKINSHLLTALSLSGVSEIYKAGGAQAIAAMGYGTKTIKKVDKLFGPGNAFVMEAKRRLFGEAGVDLLPGPSEVMIIADKTASARSVAADLLSQAEHGSGKEKIYLATTSKELVEEIPAELKRQSAPLTHADKLSKIIENGCFVVLVPDLDAAAEVANFIAPEHLELQVEARKVGHLTKAICTAGAILQTELTPTVLGDFTAGPSHTLPTGRTGRFSSGLQLIDFMRRSSVVKYDAKSIKKARKTVAAFAKMESLDAHGNSLFIREE